MTNQQAAANARQAYANAMRVMVKERDLYREALEVCLFAVTSDADQNDGKVDRAAVAMIVRNALENGVKP